METPAIFIQQPVIMCTKPYVSVCVGVHMHTLYMGIITKEAGIVDFLSILSFIRRYAL